MREKTTHNTKDHSLISKLMATENIDVRFDYVPTAHFELDNRVLVLPIYEGLSDATYSMLIAHEVSHALHTPYDGWKDFVGESKTRHMYMNVTEDARIEKLIKRRYPGVVRDMAAGYKELHERGFFGIDDNEDLSKRPLADRLNLHFKSYGHLDIPFTEDEKVWIERIESANTWKEITSITEELLASESNREEPDSSNSNEDGSSDSEDSTEETDASENADSDESDDSETSDESSNSGDDSGENEEDSADDADSTEENADDAEENECDSETGEETGKGEASEGVDDDSTDDSETFEDSTFDSASASDGNDEEPPALDSVESLENNLNENAKDNPRFNQVASVTLRDPNLDANWRETLVSSKTFIETERNRVNTYYHNTFSEDSIKTAYTRLLKRNSKTINHMIKEFELKKSAAAHKRAMVSKTGSIDMDRLHAYKTSDDLFLRNEVVPEGKNHGIVMYVDFSASMSGGRVANAIDQIFNMAVFASRVGIPYTVYAFTNTYGRGDSSNRFLGNFPAPNGVRTDSMFWVADPNFALIELTNSNLKKNDWVFSLGLLASEVLNYNNYKNRYYNNSYTHSHSNRESFYSFTYAGRYLGSTPLNAALYIAPWLINEFRSANHVDKMMFLLYTDGGGNDYFNVNSNYRGFNDSVISLNVRVAERFVDPITKKIYNAKDIRTFNSTFQSVLTDRVRYITGATVMGFNVENSYKDVILKTSATEGKRFASTSEVAKIRKEFKDRGFVELTEAFSFDSYIMLSDALHVEENSIDSELKGTAEEASTRKIAGAFTRANRKANDSRVLVRKIMDTVA